jgi:hypothetical protein
MKKLIYILLCSLPLIATSCSRENITYGDDEGRLFLSVGIDDNTKVVTRALSDDEVSELAAKCRVRLYSIASDTDLVRKYEGLSTLPSEGLKLMAGKYMVRATAGDSVEASFNKRFYEGTETFTITKGDANKVDVTCKIKNTLVKVNFNVIKEQLNNYEMVLSVTDKKSLTFNEETAEGDSTGYFILPADSSYIYWSFTGYDNSGNEFKRSGRTGNINAATLYTFNCTFESSSKDDAAVGGGVLKLSIDSTPLEVVESEIALYQRPTITGMNTENQEFDLESPTFFNPGADGEKLSLWIATSSNLTSALMSCDDFTSWGVPTNSMNLVSVMSKSESKAKLEAAGISLINRVSVSDGDTKVNMGITFSQALVKKIAEKEGSYVIELTATDEKGYERRAEWTIVVSNAAVVTSEVNEVEVWATRATLHGEVVGDVSQNLSFKYRKQGNSSWTEATGAKLSGDDISLEVTGLTPGTTYEYCVVDDGNPSALTKTFTTEAATQPENASFEYWGTEKSGSKNPIVVYSSDLGQTKWWDTGNTGSITLNKNVTQSSTEYVHSGTYSAKLKSQFVGIGSAGKFAAGNVFVGQYLATDGTNGILGWGREFHSRPAKLKGYVRYECGTVDNSSTDKLTTGSKDQGQIYIAIGDWKGEAYDGVTWPVVIKTKTAQLFDPEDEGVIAYGQQTFYESTSGSGMVEFSIDLDYYDKVNLRKPTAIIIVASASKYGDYFTGSTASTMWLDDLELVYE